MLNTDGDSGCGIENLPSKIHPFDSKIPLKTPQASCLDVFATVAVCVYDTSLPICPFRKKIVLKFLFSSLSSGVRIL